MRASISRLINPMEIRIKGLSSDQILLRFEVEDTGTGIKEEDLSRVFTAFIQLTNQPVSNTRTGLGLAISKQNIELMGGQIGVKSEVGAGSIFTRSY
jgi:signal transduction histidine kinase